MKYDFVIMGTGISGSIMGAILARSGATVLMIDAGVHPRFAIGESTIPATSRMLSFIADRYDVPELAHLASFADIRKHIGTTCGRKQNFGFVYHHAGQEPSKDAGRQLVIPDRLLGHEAHLFRQDTDAYMVNVAVNYGADIRMNTRITQFEFGEDGVELEAHTGERFSCRCVVDASGYVSPMAQKLQLRLAPEEMRHDARTVFTHMINVRPFDDCLKPGGSLGNQSRWHDGTLHHIFPGGWIWVIPFDNNPESTNPLCSVGITMRRSTHPTPSDMGPHEEFEAIVARYPAVARQFEGARAVRPWVRTERFQYGPRKTVANRYVATAHAAGFIDPLFSRGLAVTTEIINATAHRLLEALPDDDFSEERFAELDQLHIACHRRNDELVDCAYTSFEDPELWDSWFRVWALGQAFGELRIYLAHLAAKESGARSDYMSVEQHRAPGALFPSYAPFGEFWTQAVNTMTEFQRGHRDMASTRSKVLELVSQQDYGPPMIGVADPSKRYLTFSARSVIGGMKWLAQTSRKDLRQWHVDGINLVVRRLAHEARRGRLSVRV